MPASPYPKNSGSDPSDPSDSGTSQTGVGSSMTTTNNGSRPVNYLFHCAVAGTSDPMVTRMLSVPSTLTLEQMHEVMQVAFGWGELSPVEIRAPEALFHRERGVGRSDAGMYAVVCPFL